jgi:hypothetical protein
LSTDTSSLAFLHPTYPREAHFRTYKNSPRLHGSHFLSLRRPTRMPESGRDYKAGDPLNLIDWKAYARTDQLIVREIRDEASASVRIAFDVSDTMQWPTPDVPVKPLPVAKAEVAARVAFHLAHLHLKMGDQVELWLIGDGAAKTPTARAWVRGTADLLQAFEHAASKGFRADAFAGDFPVEPFNPRAVDLAFYVGDGLGGGDVLEFAQRARRFLWLHTLSSLEVQTFWIEGDTTYFDEGRGRREYQGQALRHRDNYLKNLEQWRHSRAAEVRARCGNYRLITDQTKVATYLVDLAAFAKEA